jgi:hypothetical protein
MGSKGRQGRKRQRLLEVQEALIRAGCPDMPENRIQQVVKQEMAAETPQETIAQDRHERRVFGHDISLCSCTSRDTWNLVEWNQPSPLWAGDGHRLRRRLLNRRGRNRR